MTTTAEHPNSLLTQTELAQLLCLSSEEIRRRRLTGGDLPPALVLGHRTVRFRLSDVESWLDRHVVPVGATAAQGPAAE